MLTILLVTYWIEYWIVGKSLKSLTFAIILFLSTEQVAMVAMDASSYFLEQLFYNLLILAL